MTWRRYVLMCSSCITAAEVSRVLTLTRIAGFDRPTLQLQFFLMRKNR